MTTVGRVVIANFAVAPMNTENKVLYLKNKATVTNILFQNKSIPKRVSEVKTSSPELWRAYENIWEVTDHFNFQSDVPPLGMIFY